MKTEIETPINIKEVSSISGLTLQTLYGYCKREEIPFYKKGGRLYFFKTDIIEWIKKGEK